MNLESHYGTENPDHSFVAGAGIERSPKTRVASVEDIKLGATYNFHDQTPTIVETHSSDFRDDGKLVPGTPSSNPHNSLDYTAVVRGPDVVFTAVGDTDNLEQWGIEPEIVVPVNELAQRGITRN